MPARRRPPRAISSTAVPDLRHSSEDVQKTFVRIVTKGIPGTGMAGFGEWLKEDEIQKIRKYVLLRAEEDVVRKR